MYDEKCVVKTQLQSKVKICDKQCNMLVACYLGQVILLNQIRPRGKAHQLNENAV